MPGFKAAARKRGIVVVAFAMSIEDHEKLKVFAKSNGSTVGCAIRGSIDHCLDGHHYPDRENAFDHLIEEFMELSKKIT